MMDIVNILRAMVADGTELTILRAEFGMELVAIKKPGGKAATAATRFLALSDDNDALCTALVEMYLQLRNGEAREPAIPCLGKSSNIGS